eukprot:3907699-Prymnesium_polylepis.2
MLAMVCPPGRVVPPRPRAGLAPPLNWLAAGRRRSGTARTRDPRARTETAPGSWRGQWWRATWKERALAREARTRAA